MTDEVLEKAMRRAAKTVAVGREESWDLLGGAPVVRACCLVLKRAAAIVVLAQ